MKYKPGDKVKIKSFDWYIANECGGLVECDGIIFHERMIKLCGKELTIDLVYTNDEGTSLYIMKEPETQWRFTNGMIEGPTVEEFRIFCECVNKKPTYPKTIEECVKLLGVDFRLDMDSYKRKLMANFYRLILCRDAYWKIAGEEMGLDEPWEPDWTTSGQCRYTIETNYNKFIFSKTQYGHRVLLVFPTEELRDTFYENFKDLIESCKELL